MVEKYLSDFVIVFTDLRFTSAPRDQAWTLLTTHYELAATKNTKNIYDIIDSIHTYTHTYTYFIHILTHTRVHIETQSNCTSALVQDNISELTSYEL